MTIPDDSLVYIEDDPPPFLEPYYELAYEQGELLDAPPEQDVTDPPDPFEEGQQANEDQIERLQRIMLSSAFKQIEVDRTQAWLDLPEVGEKEVRKAIAVALERRKDHDKTQAPIEDRLDSLSRRVEYHTIKAKENIKQSRAARREVKKCLKES